MDTFKSGVWIKKYQAKQPENDFGELNHVTYTIKGSDIWKNIALHATK